MGLIPDVKRLPKPLQVLVGAIRQWSAAGASRHGAALAYYTLFALAPVLVIVIAVAGAVFGEDSVRSQVVGQLNALIGQEGADLVESLLRSAREGDRGLLAAVLGGITFILGATGAFVHLQRALNHIWDVKAAPRRNLRHYLFNRASRTQVDCAEGIRRMKGTTAAYVAILLVSCSPTPNDAGGDGRIRLQATPTLDLALDADDATLIGRLIHATRLPDGRIAAIDAGANQLLLLDSVGGLIRRVGQEGAGPGEFEFPSWVGRCNGDSLFVWDPSQHRISVFGPTGEFDRQFKSPIANPMRFACNDRGMFAALDISAVPFAPPRPGVDPPDLRGPLLIFNAAADTLGAQPSLPVGQSRVLGPLAAVAVHGNEVLVGISNSSTVRRFDTRGVELARDSIDLPLRPLPDSLYQRELDRMAGFAGAEGPMRARIRDMLAASPRPDHLPLYQAMFVSPDRTFWFVTSIAVEPVTTLVGRDAEGRMLSLELPAGIEVFEVGDDYVLGKIRAEDGAERLVVYRIEHSAP